MSPLTLEDMPLSMKSYSPCPTTVKGCTEPPDRCAASTDPPCTALAFSVLRNGRLDCVYEALARHNEGNLLASWQGNTVVFCDDDDQKLAETGPP